MCGEPRARRVRRPATATAFAVVALLAVAARASPEECVYVIDNEHAELLVVQSDETRRIATGDGGADDLVLAGDAAYLNSRQFLESGTVIEVDLVGGQTVRRFPVGRGSFDIEHTNGKLYVPNQEDDTVTIIDIASGASHDLHGIPAPRRAVPSADGGMMLIAGGEGVYFVDTQIDEVTDQIRPANGWIEIAVDGSTILAAGPGGLTAYEPGAIGYELAWRVNNLWLLPSALGVGGREPGRRAFVGGLLEFGAPLWAVDIAEPHSAELFVFLPGFGIETEVRYLSAGAEHLYATGPAGLYTLSLETGELDLIRESLLFSGVRVGRCHGTPLPTRTPTATPTPSGFEPTGADECIYVTDYAGQALRIFRDEWSYSIRLARREPKGVVIGDGVAYVNHAELPDCCESTLPPPRLSVVDLPRRTLVGSHLVDNYSSDIAYAGGKLYVPNYFSERVKTIDVASGEHGQLDGPWRNPSRVAVSPDERLLYVGDGARGGHVHVVDLEELQVVHTFGSGEFLLQLALDDGGLVEARDQTLRHWERTDSGYTKTWEVRDVGFSYALTVGGGRVFSGPFIPFSRVRLPLVEVPLEPPNTPTIHDLETVDVVDPIRGADVDAAGEYLYVVGPRGLYRFSLSTSEVDLIEESETFQRVLLAPCPGEPGPTWTSTPTPTATTTLPPTRTPTPRSTATVTPTSATPGDSTPTPTQKSTFPGDGDCDGTLTAADLDATVIATYDPLARARCDADCNRDGHVNVADALCVVVMIGN